MPQMIDNTLKFENHSAHHAVSLVVLAFPSIIPESSTPQSFHRGDEPVSWAQQQSLTHSNRLWLSVDSDPYSSKCSLEPSHLSRPGSLLEMQVLRPYPIEPESAFFFFF